MPRPSKNNADYFPHYCGEGRTKRTLMREFGHKGVACFWELLELLTNADGHYLDVSDELAWFDLLDAFSLSINDREFVEEFMDILIRLKKIDGPLWYESRIIWYDNLVSNLGFLYQKRQTKPPAKPKVEHRGPSANGVESGKNGLEGSFRGENPGFRARNPHQSKAKESKANMQKGESGE